MKACQDFHIELETIDPTTNWFVLNRSKLDSTKVLAPELFDQMVDGTFILDKSALDSTKDLLEGYGATSPGHIWQEVTSTSTYVDIRRGVDVSRSVSARPYAGTMEVRIIDPYLDALANEYVGLGVRARLRVGTDLVFLGRTTRLRTEYDAIGVPTLYLSATDAIARMNSMSLAARPAENYASRISAICNAAEVFYDVSGVGQDLTPTDGEKTALETLYSAQDSEGSLVWVDRWNEVYALTRGEEGVTVDTTHTATNLIPNPSFEVDTTGWTIYGNGTLARTTTQKNFGSACAAVTQTSADYFYFGGSSFITVTAGQTYDFSAYAKSAGSGSAMLVVNFYDAGYGVTGQAMSSAFAVGSSWARHNLSFTPVANTAFVLAFLLFQGSNGEVFYVDNLQMEQGSMTDYFDGGWNGGTWNGTANNSTSTRTWITTAYIPEKYHFSNDHTVPNHICMSAFLDSLDTDEVINQIDFNNQTYDESDPLNPKFVQTTHTYTDTSSAKYYGVRKQSVSTNLDPSTLAGYAEAIFHQYSEAHSQVKSISFPMDHFKDSTIPEAVFIDVADVVKITLNDPIHTGLDNIEVIQRVAEISHRISPTYWETQLSFI